MKTLNVGIIGLGAPGRGGFGRAEYVEEIEGVSLKAVADLKPEVLQQAGERFQVETYENSDVLCERNDIDMVIIATPNYAHADPAVKALNADKHVYLEKPVAHTWEETLRIAEAARKSKVNFKTGFELRNSQIYVRAKELVESGFTGKLMTLTICHWLDFWEKESWRSNGELSGGMIVECGCHYLDFLLWCAQSKVKKLVTASPPSTVSHYKNMRDSIHTNCWLENGGVIQMSWVHTSGGAGNRKFEYRLIGTKGSIACDLEARKMVLTRHRLDSRGNIIGFDHVRTEDYSNLDWTILGHDVKGSINNFVDEIRLGKNSKLQLLDETLHSMKVCFAIEESSKTGELIILET